MEIVDEDGDGALLGGVRKDARDGIEYGKAALRAL